MLLLGSSGTGSHGEIAKAVDFDGTNDYLSRASDLTGNADGKTFTFSAWVYFDSSASMVFYANENGNVDIGCNSTNLYVGTSDSSNNTNLSATVSLLQTDVDQRTWYHVLISIDLANTSNRAIYINDIAQSVTWTTYTNSNIDFTRVSHGVGAYANSNTKVKGRLAHVFLDYTYRDLSVEANRLLFCTADRKPTPKATLAALNPILYLPMDDPTTAHINEGIGGNFALNGTVARSGRGPNQFNAPYSDLDGAADYLNRTTAPTGLSDGQVFTAAFNVQIDNTATNNRVIQFYHSVASIRAKFNITCTSTLSISARNSTDTVILNASVTNAFVAGRNYHVVVSMDLSDTNKRAIYINGSAASVTWTTYSNDTIDFAHTGDTPIWAVGRYDTTYYDGRLGNVFFDTSYIDLSQPANLAKFVTGTGIDAKPADLGANGELPFGTSPLIYLPMYGNNAGKNYGTGGDFTVNSGPYPGARGPNEYFGNKADFDGSTGYLYRTSALAGIQNSKTFSISFFVNRDTTNIFPILSSSNNWLSVYLSSSSDLKLSFRNTSNVDAFVASAGSSSFPNGTDIHCCVCVDMLNVSKFKVYVNGISVSASASVFVDSLLKFDYTALSIGQLPSPIFADGKLSEFYFTTDYIDFSQEANRLLFRDAFGNPTDLPAAIAKGAVPNPAIYMRFDPANQGLNSGTGGNFTKSGTITDGGQL